MDAWDIKNALDNVTILVDTREQDTDVFRKRVSQFGRPWERKKLNFGDYSAKCIGTQGAIDFSDCFAVERKMSLDELCTCFCSGRPRFTREFERARRSGGKTYLLIESASWEKIHNGLYRSKMAPSALTASILAWLARYNCQLIFCKPETSGQLISEILYREVKEHLEREYADQ